MATIIGSASFERFNLSGKYIWNGSSWVTLGTVTANTLVKRSVSFTSFKTDRIRISVTKAVTMWTSIVEVEAWGN